MTTSLDANQYRATPGKPQGSNGANNGTSTCAPPSNGNGETRAPARPWTCADAAKLYGIHEWGNRYFSVNDEGHVPVHPTQERNLKVDLKKLVDELRERDIQLPMLVRFTDILRHRVGKLHGAFASAIKEHDYHGDYRCVYPIKVNQQKHVVEEINEFGKEYGFGLEPDSKPEVLAGLAMGEEANTPVICNPLKDGD